MTGTQPGRGGTVQDGYRGTCGLAPDEDRRVELVDMANAIRPRTLT